MLFIGHSENAHLVFKTQRYEFGTKKTKKVLFCCEQKFSSAGFQWVGIGFVWKKLGGFSRNQISQTEIAFAL